jgi:predicted amidohydrolase
MAVSIALAQMAIHMGCPEENLQSAQALATQASTEGAALFVLPELWPTGYDLTQAGAYAAPLGLGPFATMAHLAREYGFYVAGTALEANPQGRPYNTAVIYGPDGELVGAYRKVHLFGPMGETEYLTAGDELPVFDLPWGTTAMAVCYDLRFPELWRRYTDAGACLIITPAEWPIRRVEHWRLLLRARAVENQLFVVGCNRAGSGPDGEFGGYSAALDPWGRVLAEGGEDPGLFLARLDLDEVARARRLFSFLEDRRSEVYGRA